MAVEQNALASELGLPIEYFQMIPGGFHLCEDDPEKGYPFVYLSDRFLHILGWTRDEIAEQFGNSYAALVHPEDAQAALEPAPESNGERDCGGDRIFRLFGKHGYVYVSGAARRCTLNGRTYIQGCHNSITDFVTKGERERRQLKTLNVEGRSRSEQAEIIRAVSKVFYCIYYIDMSDYSYFDLGKTTLELDDLVGTKGNAVTAFPQVGKFLIREDYYDEFVDFTDVTKLNERIGDKTWISKQFYGMTAGWSEGLFIASDRNDDGSLRHVVWAVRTIDEQKRKELAYQQELQELAAIAQSANEAKTNFLFNMSHDIRTPMNAIMGYSQLMRKGLTDPKLLDYQDKIDRSSRLLLSIINNVLDMARIDSGETEVHEDHVRISSIPAAITDVLGADADRKGISLRYTVNVRHDHVVADVTKLNEIFMNITSNAIKYTQPGGTVMGEIDELPCDREGYALIRTRITDNGIGMSEEYLPRIFDSFTRERDTTTGKVAGTGLGMAIVKKLVELMNGTIQVESREGEGSVFTVTIPHRIAEGFFYESSQGVSPEEREEFLQGRRVLLAEDNELNAEIALAILEDIGLVVDHVEDGQQCLDRVKSEPAGTYDLILMDVQMPVMSGYEATRALRALDDGAKASIPVIAMTANAFEEDKADAARAGMSGHISKPIDVQKIEQEMVAVLSR
ncbi:MAG: ATP-binding protein [Coriobacteriia bacterium]|nr:ATP-binding protein [Coriobacteriia bacterium]